MHCRATRRIHPSCAATLRSRFVHCCSARHIIGICDNRRRGTKYKATLHLGGIDRKLLPFVILAFTNQEVGPCMRWTICICNKVCYIERRVRTPQLAIQYQEWL